MHSNRRQMLLWHLVTWVIPSVGMWVFGLPWLVVHWSRRFTIDQRCFATAMSMWLLFAVPLAVPQSGAALQQRVEALSDDVERIERRQDEHEREYRTRVREIEAAINKIKIDVVPVPAIAREVRWLLYMVGAGILGAFGWLLRFFITRVKVR